jgi:hypothetical protein
MAKVKLKTKGNSEVQSNKNKALDFAKKSFSSKFASNDMERYSDSSRKYKDKVDSAAKTMSSKELKDNGIAKSINKSGDTTYSVSKGLVKSFSTYNKK